MRRRRKSDRSYDDYMSVRREADQIPLTVSARDYAKFLLYCLLLVIPVYAITKSAVAHNWIMVLLDLLLIPIGFVHGLFMIFGFVD